MITALIFWTTLASATPVIHFRGSVFVRHHGIEEPVGGALVGMYSDEQYPAELQQQVITASDGSFDFQEITVAKHLIRIWSNYDPIGGMIDIVSEDAQSRRKFIVLEPTCWAVQGRVRDVSTGDDIARASIHYLGTGVSNAQGDYFIDWGCGVVAFRFHNTFFISAIAPGFHALDEMAGRAEDISSGVIRDLDLTAKSVRAPCCDGPERKIP